MKSSEKNPFFGSILRQWLAAKATGGDEGGEGVTDGKNLVAVFESGYFVAFQ